MTPNNNQGSACRITVVVPTLDEAANIAACIESVRWADRIIVVDGGSGDDTVKVARERGADVIQVAGMSIGEQRNVGIARAGGDWILALDADERGTPGLEQKLREAALASDHVFSLRRLNYFRGRVMRYGGWGGRGGRRGQRVARFLPSTLRFETKRVHERLDFSRPVTPLDADILHEPYPDYETFERKLNLYAKWGAAQLKPRSRVELAVRAALHPPARFLRAVILRLGLLDGWRGLRLAWWGARAARLKYVLALQMNRDRRER
ncbi:MAG: glycosyltransferase family 2 protein [Gemmatimonadales bacterium]